LHRVISPASDAAGARLRWRLEKQEERYRLELDLDVVPEMVNAVRSRYDLTDETPDATAPVVDIDRTVAALSK
jgi:hypothetical protein